MDKSKKTDLGIILVCFIAFALGVPLVTDNYQAHISGIALGFGLAWTIKLLIENKKTE